MFVLCFLCANEEVCVIMTAERHDFAGTDGQQLIGLRAAAEEVGIWQRVSCTWREFRVNVFGDAKLNGCL